MVKVKILHPIVVGGAVYPKGETVELDEDIVKAYANDVEAVIEESEVEEEEIGYADMTVANLKKLCEEREIEIPSGSNKAAIVALLEESEVEEEVEE